MQTFDIDTEIYYYNREQIIRRMKYCRRHKEHQLTYETLDLGIGRLHAIYNSESKSVSSFEQQAKNKQTRGQPTELHFIPIVAHDMYV